MAEDSVMSDTYFDPKNDPWTRISKETAFETHWIKVESHDCLDPAGNPATYGTVHFKNKAVGIIPYEDGLITLVGQYRFPLREYSWELPEGGCPEGSTPLEAAKRELKEETGLSAQNFKPFMKLHLSNSITDEWAIVYLATGLTQGEAQPEDSEVLRLRKITLEDLIEEIEDGKITDAITVAAAYKLALRIAQDKI